MNLQVVYKKWDGVWSWCALLGSNLLVSGKNVCCYIVPKFVNYNLSKSSLVGYILIALGLQNKFKIVAG